jgi:putative addiction module killer protein
MEATRREIRVYQTRTGRLPFIEWLNLLRDLRAKQQIQARIDRVSLGNLGHTRSVGEGVQELKVDFGPGYRVYFGLSGNELVILLCGGTKGRQDEDIKEAKAYWKDYTTEKAHER